MGEYKSRDHMKLDELGGYYHKHLVALTVERLYSKNDIAAELGFRDYEIYHLTKENKQLKDKLRARDNTMKRCPLCGQAPTGNPGEKNGNSKLTENEVLHIKARLKAGESIEVLADDYNVGPTAIRDIRDGNRWRNL